MQPFRIWFEGADREAGTGAIRMEVAQHTVTRLENRLENTTRDAVRAGIDTLALWLAANWWRLRWEPSGTGPDWAMSHCLAAAGEGYVWPDLTLWSDGEAMWAQCGTTDCESGEPVRFLTAFSPTHFPVEAFETGVDTFMEKALDCLPGEWERTRAIREIWEAVKAEREDREATAHRKLEALLGHDPDEVPENTMRAMKQAVDDYGRGATAELAVAGRTGAVEYLQELRERAGGHAVPAHMAHLEAVRRQLSTGRDAMRLPWQRAEHAAGLVRSHESLAGDLLDDKTLAGMAGVGPDVLSAKGRAIKAPYSVAFRDPENPDRNRVFLGKAHSTQRRFYLARLIGDYLDGPADDRLLPATNTYTARQKFQRAFAQELLCPFEALKAFLAEETGVSDPDLLADYGDELLDEDVIQDAADHFAVGGRLITTKLVNKGILSRDVLPG